MRSRPLWALLFALLAGGSAPSLVSARPAQVAPVRAAEPHDVVELCAPPNRIRAAGGTRHRRRALLRRSAVLLRAAVVDYDAGRFADSLRTLHRAYALIPQADTLFNMAQTCRAAGRAEQALTLYAATLRAGPDLSLRADTQRRSSELRDKLAQKHDEHARQLLESQDYSGAQTAWEIAYSVSPQPIFQFRIAQAQERGGQLREALAAYERFLHDDPKSELRPEAEHDVVRLQGRLESAAAQQHSEYPSYLDADPPTSLHTEVSATVEPLNLQLAPPERSVPVLLPTALALAPPPLLDLPSSQKAPVHRRWWFWTAMSAGAAAIVIPVLVTQLPIQPSYQDLRMVTFSSTPTR